MKMTKSHNIPLNVPIKHAVVGYAIGTYQVSNHERYTLSRNKLQLLSTEDSIMLQEIHKSRLVANLRDLFHDYILQG